MLINENNLDTNVSFQRDGVLNPFLGANAPLVQGRVAKERNSVSIAVANSREAKKKGNNIKPRYIGKFYNRIKRGNGFTVLEAVFLSTLIDLYKKAQKNGHFAYDNWFPTSLGEIMVLSGIPIYNQIKLINELMDHNIIDYDPLEWDFYDEGSNITVLFKLNLCEA